MTKRVNMSWTESDEEEKGKEGEEYSAKLVETRAEVQSWGNPYIGP